jgi:excisionase family DNA binding protein
MGELMASSGSTEEIAGNNGARTFERFVGPDGAAEFLGFSPKTLQKWAREGKIPAHAFGNGRRRYWRFLLSELDTWRRAQ